MQRNSSTNTPMGASSQQPNTSGVGNTARAGVVQPAVAVTPWNAFATPAIGKMVRIAARVTRHGGSAFPGKIVESIDPGFLARTLGRLPLGVILVSGTNGKTTTTRMVATMLERLGLKVFTNPTGSNFTRGVVSALLTEVDLRGHLNADIAVLELDEAYAVHFVRQVKPRYCLLLNVMRDQLDRFGEIDNTARLLGHVAEATTGTVMLNREDPRIASLAALAQSAQRVAYFGLDASLKSFFPSDDEMQTTVDLDAAAGHAVDDSADADDDDIDAVVAAVDPANTAQPDAMPVADVTLLSVADHAAQFQMDGAAYNTTVQLEGIYNLFNAAAALAIVHAVRDDVRNMIAADDDREIGAAGVAADTRRRLQRFADAGAAALIDAVAQATPAFGRGEVIDVHGSPVELLLVKNPMGFRLSLASFPPQGHDTMICINDEYADGRDMSWLWDVDFSSLRGTGVDMVSGVRAWDMALRLGYDQVAIGETNTDLEQAVTTFVNANPGTPKHIYCTYTAMLKVRSILGGITDVADAGVGK